MPGKRLLKHRGGSWLAFRWIEISISHFLFVFKMATYIVFAWYYKPENQRYIQHCFQAQNATLWLLARSWPRNLIPHVFDAIPTSKSEFACIWHDSNLKLQTCVYWTDLTTNWHKLSALFLIGSCPAVKITLKCDWRASNWILVNYNVPECPFSFWYSKWWNFFWIIFMCVHKSSPILARLRFSHMNKIQSV